MNIWTTKNTKKHEAKNLDISYNHFGVRKQKMCQEAVEIITNKWTTKNTKNTKQKTYEFTPI